MKNKLLAMVIAAFTLLAGTTTNYAQQTEAAELNLQKSLKPVPVKVFSTHGTNGDT